jgi:hypothetical protein
MQLSLAAVHPVIQEIAPPARPCLLAAQLLCAATSLHTLYAARWSTVDGHMAFGTGFSASFPLVTLQNVIFCNQEACAGALASLQESQSLHMDRPPWHGGLRQVLQNKRLCTFLYSERYSFRVTYI